MADHQEYVTLEDARERLGVARGTLYYYISALKIEKHRFPLDRHAYLTKEDFERIKTLKDQAAQRAGGQHAA